MLTLPVVSPAVAPALDTYDTIIVAFSGGKDSMACLLHLFELGVPASKIELWHHDVDGREGSTLMDWSMTRSYCEATAKAFGLSLYYSWLEGGFEREMTKENARKAATVWENPDGTLGRAGGVRGKVSTRRKFPQVSANLSVRWCSPYLKIDVCATAIRNQARFTGARTLVVTGERAEESAARAKYATFEHHKADNRNAKRDSSRRHVDAWRPVHGWSEQAVWDIMERFSVRPHPAYLAGFGRVSCQFCIFGNADQWATARAVSPDRFDAIADYEESFGVTLKRKGTLRELVTKGTPYPMTELELAACRSESYAYESVLLPAGEEWTQPKGAFGESCGPS